MGKPFSPELYESNDGPARERLTKALKALWQINLYDNTDQYGPDLVAYRDGRFIGFVEVEIKHNWRGEVFPFETIHFPHRKAKFLDRRCIFVILNAELTHFVWFNTKDLIHGKVISKDTRLTKGESFIEVRANKGKWGRYDQG